MFYYLINKTFIGASLMIVTFGVFLFFIDSFSESLISTILGYNFYYQAPAFLKLIYLVLLAVTIGIFSALNRTEHLEELQKQKLATRYILSIIVAGVIGLCLHLYFVKNAMEQDGSLVALEQNIFRYYITDMFLVLGFLVGGLSLRKGMHGGVNRR